MGTVKAVECTKKKSREGRPDGVDKSLGQEGAGGEGVTNKCWGNNLVVWKKGGNKVTYFS